MADLRLKGRVGECGDFAHGGGCWGEFFVRRGGKDRGGCRGRGWDWRRRHAGGGDATSMAPGSTIINHFINHLCVKKIWHSISVD